MLKHLISHFQQFYDLCSSTSPATPLYHLPSPSLCPLLSDNPAPGSSSSFPDMNETSVERKSAGVSERAGMAVTLQLLEPHKPPAAKRPRRGRRRAKASGSRNATTVVMDEQIWNKLPEDLFEPVISRLPIAAFFRFRSVSRRWNSLLETRSFSQHCEEFTHAEPLIYAISYEHVNTGSIYDPSAKKWRHPDAPPPPSEVILLPTASAGGLVCCLDLGDKYFYLCNPLTQAWKQLPPKSVAGWHHAAVGMALNQDSASRGYKIIWICEDGDFEVYDSLKDSWLGKGRIPGNVTLPLSLPNRSHLVSVGSITYFLRTNPGGIVSYDGASGTWKQLLIPFPLNSNDHFLAEHRGRVMLVGLMKKNLATCVCVWELQKMTLLWQEVDRMPSSWSLDFYAKHVRMTCLGNSGMVMMSLKSRQMNRILSYDVARRQWSKVPGCVTPGGRRRQWMTGGVAFYPCLTAQP